MKQKNSAVGVWGALLGTLLWLSVASAQTSAPAPNYIIGPGDELKVFVWQNPDLSVEVPVRPDGKISTPLDEDMVAVGKTPSQLAHDIETKLSDYVRSPHVNVIVTKPASLYSQVKVIGQVKTPEAIAYHQGMTVLDAVLAVGGLTEYAAGNRARIIRSAGGTEQDIPVRLGALVNSGDMSQNLPLKPGDVLVVPESRF
ncbi:MAG TPA: XrtA/PEP-CTERM system exopolysaccharide export protein [Steroidobacteraceae bacterium]|nr:XrtA/PEP-CTERM system exopolysaccharide export protein [Steroidobacteraceae bacterium]